MALNGVSDVTAAGGDDRPVNRSRSTPDIHADALDRDDDGAVDHHRIDSTVELESDGDSSSVSTASSEVRRRIREEFDYRVTRVQPERVGGPLNNGGERSEATYAWRIPTVEELAEMRRKRAEAAKKAVRADETYKPTINKSSSHLRMISSSRPRNVVERLGGHDVQQRRSTHDLKVRQKTIEVERVEERERRHCTFKPKVNKNENLMVFGHGGLPFHERLYPATDW